LSDSGALGWPQIPNRNRNTDLLVSAVLKGDGRRPLGAAQGYQALQRDANARGHGSLEHPSERTSSPGFCRATRVGLLQVGHQCEQFGIVEL
jgi:hypothetical protein